MIASGAKRARRPASRSGVRHALRPLRPSSGGDLMPPGNPWVFSLVIVGFQTFAFTLLLEMASRVISERRIPGMSGRSDQSYGQVPVFRGPVRRMAFAPGDPPASAGRGQARGPGARVRLPCQPAARPEGPPPAWHRRGLSGSRRNCSRTGTGPFTRAPSRVSSPQAGRRPLPDVVLLISSVLEHLREPQAALGAVRRVLRPGGMLLINVPTWRGKFFSGVFPRFASD